MRAGAATGLVPAGAILAASLLLSGCGPDVTRYAFDAIDTSQDPVQEALEEPESVQISRGGVEWTLDLRAAYRLRGVVLSRETYRFDAQAALAPCDVAVAWGDLLRDDLYKKVHWSQSGRWYWWQYGSGFPGGSPFIVRHSSNNHVIPATENVSRAARSLRRGQAVDLSGFLVDVRAKRGSETFTWHTSTRREDEGNGSCEVFYVRRVRVADRVYE